jgi:hypothetical protein
MSSTGTKKSKRFSGPSRRPAQSQAVPTASSLKSSIRSLRRFLQRPNAELSPELRKAKEIEIELLERNLAQKLEEKRQKTVDERYKNIKFFEKRKILRKIAQLRKKLSNLASNSTVPTEEEREIREEMKKQQENLDYIDFYPRGMKYVALFASVRSNQANPEDSDGSEGSDAPNSSEKHNSQLSAAEIQQKQAELEAKRAEIRELVKKNKLSATKVERKAEQKLRATNKKRFEAEKEELFVQDSEAEESKGTGKGIGGQENEKEGDLFIDDASGPENDIRNHGSAANTANSAAKNKNSADFSSKPQSSKARKGKIWEKEKKPKPNQASQGNSSPNHAEAENSGARAEAKSKRQKTQKAQIVKDALLNEYHSDSDTAAKRTNSLKHKPKNSHDKSTKTPAPSTKFHKSEQGNATENGQADKKPAKQQENDAVKPVKQANPAKQIKSHNKSKPTLDIGDVLQLNAPMEDSD